MWLWFTSGGWILAAGGVVVLGLVAAAVVVGATARKRAYARDAGKPNGARHVLAVVEQAQEQDFYGSMDLTEERDWRGYTHPMGYGWVPAPPSWREQTAADLSPEALALDSGPGEVVPLAPGPDPGSGPGMATCQLLSNDLSGGWNSATGPEPDWLDNDGWLDERLAAHVAWVARMAPMVTGWSVAA